MNLEYVGLQNDNGSILKTIKIAVLCNARQVVSDVNFNRKITLKTQHVIIRMCMTSLFTNERFCC